MKVCLSFFFCCFCLVLASALAHLSLRFLPDYPWGRKTNHRRCRGGGGAVDVPEAPPPTTWRTGLPSKQQSETTQALARPSKPEPPATQPASLPSERQSWLTQALVRPLEPCEAGTIDNKPEEDAVPSGGESLTTQNHCSFLTTCRIHLPRESIAREAIALSRSSSHSCPT